MFPAGVPNVRTRITTLACGVRVRVAEAGNPSAPAVLLLHGWGASVYMWRAWFTPLAAAGWRPIAVDLPGHGLSDKPAASSAYRLENQVGSLRELLDAEGLDRVHLVAQSMAGTIALDLALAGDARLGRLVLVNPASFGRVRLQALARAVSPPPIDAVLHRLVARWLVARAHRLVYGDPTRITPRDEDEYWAPSQFPSYARAMRRLLHEFTWQRRPVEEMAARFRQVSSPVLVILGGLDRLVRDAGRYSSALLAAGVPLLVHVIARGGHAVNEERPEEVLAVVMAFLGDPHMPKPPEL